MCSSANLLCLQEISYVSRRRMDDATFDANAVDADGLPLVYNEVRAAVLKRPCGCKVNKIMEGCLTPGSSCFLQSHPSPATHPLPALPQEAIAEYWKGKPGELASRWTKFAGISGALGPATTGCDGSLQMPGCWWQTVSRTASAGAEQSSRRCPAPTPQCPG